MTEKLLAFLYHTATNLINKKCGKMPDFDSKEYRITAALPQR